MAASRFFSVTSLLLLSLLILASASDYTYNSKPETEISKPQSYGYNPKPKSEDNYKPKPKDYGCSSQLDADKPKTAKPENKPKPEDQSYGPKRDVDKPKPKNDGHGTKPTVDEPKPKENGYGSKPDDNLDKPKSEDKSESEYCSYDSKPNTDKPKYENDHEYNTKTKSGEKEQPFPVSIEGLILCKSVSGSKFYPIQGAVVRITCIAVDEYGYWKKSVSIRSPATDAKGYYLAKLSPSELTDSLKLKGCKAFLENSSSETYKIPSVLNKGISGADHLISSRILNNNKMKLYSLRPFVFTSEPESAPNGY